MVLSLPSRPTGNNRAIPGPVVVIVNVVLTTPELGITEAGLKLQVARAGSPLHEKLMGPEKEPCEPTISTYSADCPLTIVSLVGFAVTAMLGEFGDDNSVTKALWEPLSVV